MFKFMVKAVILVEKMYEELEVWYPALRLKEAGVRVVFAGPKAGETYFGKHGYPVISDKVVSDINAKDFDLVVIPGGFAPDYLRRDVSAVLFVKKMWDEGKVVAAVCHGVWLPASAGIIKGRKVTSFFAIKDDIVNAGGVWEDSPVVVDGKLVTSRKPEDLPEFLKAILSLMALS